MSGGMTLRLTKEEKNEKTYHRRHHRRGRRGHLPCVPGEPGEGCLGRQGSRAKGTVALVTDGAPKAGAVTVSVAKKSGGAVVEAVSSASGR